MRTKRKKSFKLRAAAAFTALLVLLYPGTKVTAYDLASPAGRSAALAAPVISVNNILSVSGTSAVILSSYLSSTYSNGVTLTYTLTSPPQKGSLYNSYSQSIISVNGSFTQADINAGYIVYTAAPGASGEDSFSFAVSDGGSCTTGTFRLNLSSVNQAPVLAENKLLSISEAASTAITADLLKVTDVEQGPNALSFTLTAAPQNGWLYKNNTMLTAGSVFTQEDINLKSVYYKHNGTKSQQDCFKFQVSDGKGGTIQETLFRIAVVLVNDIPQIINNTGLNIDEDSGPVSIKNTQLKTIDRESITLSYKLTEVPLKGTLYKEGRIMNAFDNKGFTQADIDSGLITFMPAPDNAGQDSFSFTVSDGGNELTGKFNIYIIPKNDPPALAVNKGLSLDEHSSQIISKYMLEVSDRDQTASQIVFTLATAPKNGMLYKAGSPLSQNAVFTQEDVNNGNLIYKHIKNETTKDSFGFTVTDGAGGSIALNTFNISVRLVDDPPMLESNTGLVINEDGAAAAVIFKAVDPEGQQVSYTVSALPLKGSLLYKKTGAAVKVGDNLKQTDIDSGDLLYKPKPNANGTDSLGLKVSDGKISTLITVGITITPVNDPPVISSTKNARWVSGKTGLVYTAQGSDIDGDAIKWSISGTDAKLFSMDSKSGQLKFLAVPNYYQPGDNDHNNNYELLLTASDGKLSTDLTLTISVDPSVFNGDGNGTDSTAAVLINGSKYQLGVYETSKAGDGRESANMLIGSEEIEELLNYIIKGSVITVSIPNEYFMSSVELTGDIIKLLEEREALLVLETSLATYTLPIVQIDISSVAEKLGAPELKDVIVKVMISQPEEELSSKVEYAAEEGGYSIVLPAVDFTVMCSYGGSYSYVDTFKAFIDRLIPVPDTIDPDSITTGVVVEANGNTYHVPTQLVTIGSRYYVKISSMTNSTYTLISKKVQFTDVKAHWAEYEINDMGSRLIINGMGGNRFEPDRYMTRAEFSAVIVKALGLAPGMGSCQFTDVKTGDWFKVYIETAVEYGLIYGYGDGSFGPNETISREQAMTMMARALKLVGLTVKLDSNSISQMMTLYKDGFDTSRYAGESVAVCLYYGLISGRNGNYLAPKKEITRAEVAVMVQRMLVKANLI